MSGTSLDGLDVSIIYTNGIDIYKFHKNYYFKYPNTIILELQKLVHSKNPQSNLIKLKKISDLITVFFAEQIKTLPELKLIDLIGFHGQTIFYNPSKKQSLQLGSPQLMSNILNKNIIFNFRKNDLKNGGQGAPIAPIYHKYLIKLNNISEPACFVNIGGISNLTYVDENKLIGFDTGPGNCLIDFIMSLKFNKKFDDKGKTSSQGKVNLKLLNKLVRDEYFNKNYPKSLDKIYFNKYLNHEILKTISSYDLLATLSEFTAESIHKSIKILP